MSNQPYGDKRPPDMRVPEAGLAAFPSGAPVAPNMPFAPGKTWYPQRILLAAASKVQVSQNPLACQKVIVLNEGIGSPAAGDLIVGNQGVSLNPPTANNPQPAFSIPVGASLTIEVQDASQVWLGSVAGTIASIATIGASYTAGPQITQVSPPYQVL